MLASSVCSGSTCRSMRTKESLTPSPAAVAAPAGMRMGDNACRRLETSSHESARPWISSSRASLRFIVRFRCSRNLNESVVSWYDPQALKATPASLSWGSTSVSSAALVDRGSVVWFACP